jgi:hypothetical protein
MDANSRYSVVGSRPHLQPASRLSALTHDASLPSRNTIKIEQTRSRRTVTFVLLDCSLQRRQPAQKAGCTIAAAPPVAHESVARWCATQERGCRRNDGRLLGVISTVGERRPTSIPCDVGAEHGQGTSWSLLTLNTMQVSLADRASERT